MKMDVGLREDKQGIHAIDDHPEDISRTLSYPHVLGVVEQPRFIYYDSNYEQNKRVKYSDQIYMEQYGHLQNLVVVVDTDREPHEVVTWMVKSNTKQEKMGVVIYDSRADKTS